MYEVLGECETDVSLSQVSARLRSEVSGEWDAEASLHQAGARCQASATRTRGDWRRRPGEANRRV